MEAFRKLSVTSLPAHLTWRIDVSGVVADGVILIILEGAEQGYIRQRCLNIIDGVANCVWVRGQLGNR